MTILNAPSRRLRLAGAALPIVLATVALFLVSPLVASGSISPAAVRGMVPFAAVLAIAAIGQTLVVQQRGLDLSVPGMMALGGVLASALPQWYGWSPALAIIAAVVLPAVAGAITGYIVTVWRVMPLVVTLGMNALLLGTVFAIARGTPAGAPGMLTGLVKAQLFGFPAIVLVAAVLTVVAAVVAHRTTTGWRLTAIGMSEPAARALGLTVARHRIAAYALAGCAYGAAGVIYTGYVTTPPLFFGDTYLLPTVAAVVLGGTPLTGGRAAIIGTAVAALFLTQLGQLLRAVGWPEPAQLIAQAVVLIVVVIARVVVPVIARSRQSAPSVAAV